MSRLYFHAEHETAELWGGEFHWLDQLARNTAIGLLDPLRNDKKLRPLICVGNDLRDGYRTGLGCLNNWASWFTTSWRVDYEPFLEWRGRPLSCSKIGLNTAAVSGGEAARFAIRLAAQADIHCWVDGPDRAWCADVIEEGLGGGVLRRRVKAVDVGWEKVQALLRASDGGAVVTSYSVEDGFPNPKVARFAPEIPADWRPDGWSDGDWDEIDDECQGEYRDQRVGELFYDLPKPEQWAMSLDALRARPAANLQIQPGGGAFHFGPNITAFDLLADDRDARLEAAFADYDAALGDGRAEE